MRSSFLIVCLMLVIARTAAAAESPVDLAKIDRKIAREPEYENQPHYALLVFGPEGKHRTWLVIDGESVAYVDRNGNGDLTELGERVDLDVEDSLIHFLTIHPKTKHGTSVIAWGQWTAKKSARI